ncbi:MAG: hypothetical protein QOH63_2000 [Acidobacteriota bacterium]|nr:hypothetical protein [Acidobacteriota bacterium]
MSRVYFHEQEGDSEVRGSERAYASYLCNEVFLAALNLNDYDSSERPSVLRNIIAPSHYVVRYKGREFAQSLKTALVVPTSDELLVVEGKRVEVFSAALNTALIMGSDPIKLMARLHGQCEIHAYIEGKNRDWVAGIIEKGRASGIMRADVGWEETITMLRSNSERPVVTSYSVCEQFPNAGAAKWTPPVNEDGEDWDTWYDLPREERWRLGMEDLRAESLLEIKPDDWDTYYFRDGVNGFKLLEAAYALQPTSD